MKALIQNQDQVIVKILEVLSRTRDPSTEIQNCQSSPQNEAQGDVDGKEFKGRNYGFNQG